MQSQTERALGTNALVNINTFISDEKAALFRQMEGTRHLLHLFVAHAFGLIAHGTAIDIDLCALRQHVDLIKGVHDIRAFCKDAVLFPQHDVVVGQGVERAFSEFHTTGQFVGHNAQS